MAPHKMTIVYKLGDQTVSGLDMPWKEEDSLLLQLLDIEKGSTLLLLGQKDKDDKPVRESRWNQYHSVDQEPEIHFQARAKRKWFPRAWVSSPFHCACEGADASSSSLEVGGAFQEILGGSLVPDECKDIRAELM
ncbi:hypothetical protein SAY87_011476 [Trapa incisa]|uniref:Uncharacterized protein n=1 Tax=Trapa incisa TaxID=236973 RepID=A0AAN7JIC0_9MYRT|nr:hypothetical protein SAY87_011476 [Trapa incisa]